MTLAKAAGNSLGKKGVKRSTKARSWKLRHWLFLTAGVAVALASVVTWKLVTAAPAPAEPPEAAKVLAAQDNLKNFGILIPAYLPKGFDRAAVDIRVNNSGPASEPAVDMVYRTPQGASIFLRQWVPVNPDQETLNGSRLIETKWGKSYLLTEGITGLIAIWVDVGPLRVSLFTSDRDLVSREQLVLAAETLGLASNMQAYSFVTELPAIKDIAPPPPFIVKINEQGIQELNLVITPGGYSPMRFAVQKDTPVKIIFRAMGEVGCGNTMIFPADPQNPSALTLKSKEDFQVLEFTPTIPGEFQFECTNNCYRGVMTVRD
jgi:hypothetical protein